MLDQNKNVDVIMNIIEPSLLIKTKKTDVSFPKEGGNIFPEIVNLIEVEHRFND